MNAFTAAREWLRGADRGTRGSTSSVRSRVALPAVVDIHPDVLRALWRLDPRLDAYTLPDGTVWLLQRQEERGRIAHGRAQLAEDRASGMQGFPNYSASLMADGWALLAIVPYVRAQSPSYMVRAASEVLNRSKAEMDAQELALREINDGSAAQRNRARVISDRIRSSAAFDWSWGFRGRKSFTSKYSKSA